MKLLIFGGTTEGRVLARRAAELGAEVTVSVATPLGAEELAGIPGICVTVGRLDGEAIASLTASFDRCVDATHPYAVEVTDYIRAGCARTNTPLMRLLRAESGAEGAVRCADCREAAAFLAEREGNVLIATGSRQLRSFAELDPARLFPRLLPTHEGLSLCEELGIPHRNILALQGPFSRRMNEAMLEQYHIAWMVTKDGGGPGGFREKLEAARAMGVGLILIDRPRDGGADMEAVLSWIQEGLS